MKWLAFAGVAGIFVVVALGYSLWTQKSIGGAEAMTGHGTSLIVMPFEGIDENADNGPLASGITQEVISNLMRFPDFRLYSVPATFRQNPKADPSTVGRDVGVSYVVNGSVRGDGDRVRVGAQLVDVGTGEILWTTMFDRDRFPGDLLELPRELSASIASELGQPYGVIKTHVIDGISQNVNPSMSSYDCVLRAYVYRRSFSEDLYGPTLDCLKAATQRDPRYAEAWALLGWLYLDTARFDLVPLDDKEHVYALAIDAASKAVAVDKTNVMALKALAAINHYTGHYSESERFQLQALELNPNDPDTLAQLGWRLAVRGRFDEGVPYIERAIARSVNPPGWYFHLIVVSLYLQGRFPEMLNLAQRSGVEDSALSWSFIAIANAELGNRSAARQALARMAEIDPLLGRDPAGVYRSHQATDAIVDALVTGLRKAGWTESEEPVL